MIYELKGVLSDLYGWYNRFYGSSGGGAKETDGVFSFGVGSGPSDDLEFGRLKATDKEDSLWGMKQQEEDINKGKKGGTIIYDILTMLSNLKGMAFGHVQKRFNKAAHELAKYALGISEDVYWMEDYLGCITKEIEADKPG
ncbi:hypothetical protein LWI29_031662 [Acer saccharum]|uniref:RNase H type-1 domain-containing protein n=1 Tax=Acer saccharum TaxID=4024 RepID=A0AA39TAH2_ACESA|nr:hypothetical protein LWI29_031662 [Acer saccharum]